MWVSNKNGGISAEEGQSNYNRSNVPEQTNRKCTLIDHLSSPLQVETGVHSPTCSHTLERKYVANKCRGLSLSPLGAWITPSLASLVLPLFTQAQRDPPEEQVLSCPLLLPGAGLP